MDVEISGFCKTIKGVSVLDEVNMRFESGRVYGLQGRNGSGKTMLLRAIAGLIHPTSGYVRVGEDVLGKGRSFPENIGVLIESPTFIEKYTGRKNLELLAGIRGRVNLSDVDKTMKRVGLEPADRRHYRKYSLGMKQRLGIACAVMERPDIILLDEPFNALDPSGAACVERVIQEEKARGALIVVACHDVNELKLLADEIATMAEGRVLSLETVPQ